jgi:hypothetical protein
MAVRGRASSSTPQETVEAMADRSPMDVPVDGQTRSNRVSGLASLMGLATGVTVGAVYGAATVAGRPPWWLASGMLSLAAMLGGNAPMAKLGVTDPRQWDVADWASDVVPHLAFGLVTALVFEAVDEGE